MRYANIHCNCQDWRMIECKYLLGNNEILEISNLNIEVENES